MKKMIKKMAAVLAVAVVSTFGMQACGDDAAQQLLLLLGEADGPTAEELSDFFTGSCEGLDCDGDIMDLSLGASKGEVIEGTDDDLTALIESLVNLTHRNPYVEELHDNFHDLLLEAYPEGAPAGGVTFGPLLGTANLADACAPGSGGILASLTETYEEVEAPMEGGVRGIDGFLSQHFVHVLSLSGCTIEDILDDDVVTLTGGLTVTDIDNEDEGSASISWSGSFQVNPGESAPAAGVAGTDPTIIWGFSETLTINATYENDSLDGVDFSGGACYGGTTVSQSGCEGIFVPADEIMPWLYF